MKKILTMCAVAVLFVSNNVHAEDDKNLCMYHNKFFNVSQNHAKAMGDGFQDLLSKKEDYGMMIFLVKTSRCESFRKEHEAELTDLEVRRKKVELEIEKIIQAGE